MTLKQRRFNIFISMLKQSRVNVVRPLSDAIHLGPVVQSIVNLTSSLRGQLVKCFTTLKPNTLIFLVEKKKKKEKLLHFKSFLTKNIGIFKILAFEILIQGSNMVCHALTFARSRGRC